MAVDCIPHASGHFVPRAHHVVRHHHYPEPLTPIVTKVATKPRVVRHHVRLRECPPGAVIVPLADLNNDNVAEIYMLPSGRAPAAGDQAVTGDAVATTGTPDATPAEASGLDLPASGLSDIGSMGGGSGDSNGLPPGSGGGGVGSGGSGGRGGGSGTGSGAGGSTGGGGSTNTGGGSSGVRGSPGTGSGVGGAGGGGGLVVAIPLITGGGSLPTGGGNSGGGGASGVPEPSTWALMLIGVGALGARLRSSRGRQNASERSCQAGILPPPKPTS